MSFLKKKHTATDKRKKFKNPYTKKTARIKEFSQNNGGAMKLFAIVFILFLMVADFFAMYQLFFDPEYDLDMSSVIFFSLMFAAFLEGLPTVCSYFLSIIIDRNIDEVGKKGRSAIGFILSFLGIIGIFALAVKLRLMQIESHGGAEDNPSYIVEFFLIFEPIFSSVLAFVVAWMAFSSNYISSQKKRIDFLTKVNDSYAREYQETVNTYNSMRRELWNDLLINNKTFADDWHEYCNITYTAIREKVIWDCINFYPLSIKKFNESVETTLQELLFEMSKLTPLELNITSIDINTILEKFDTTRNGAGAWNYNECASPLTKKLYYFLIRRFGDAPSKSPDNDKLHEIEKEADKKTNNKPNKKRDIETFLDISYSKPEQKISKFIDAKNNTDETDLSEKIPLDAKTEKYNASPVSNNIEHSTPENDNFVDGIISEDVVIIPDNNNIDDLVDAVISENKESDSDDDK